MRYVFYLLWVVAVPSLLSFGTVWLLSPSNDADDVGVLRKFVGGQKIPAAIVFFMIFAMVVWRFRHVLPLAFAIGPGRRDLPPKLRGRFEEASILLSESRRILKTKKKDVERELTTTERERVAAALDELERTMSDVPFAAPAFEAALGKADRAVGEHLSRWRKGEIREYAESILIAVAVAALVRVAIFEPFKIPTGSMIPTLLVGDHIFVNKSSYGPLVPFTDTRIFESLPPDRADVMVFKYPENPDQDYIKRVIAVPGDTLEVLNGRPVLNGWLVPHCHVGTLDAGKVSEGAHELYVEFLHGQSYFTQFRSITPDREGERDGAKGCKAAHDCANGQQCLYGVCASEHKGPYYVAKREVWVLGDNRDNSHDSRAWKGGLGAGVPFENIKGRAMFVFATFGGDGPKFLDRFLVNVMGRPTLPANQDELKAGLDKCLHEMPKETDPPPAN
jgi:signal peptidase I